MFDFKTLLEDIWPEDVFGGIDPDEDLAKLFEGMAEDYQTAYDQINLIANIRNPRLTGDLADLEREYGIVPDGLLSDAVRRQMLAHVKYQPPTTQSWEHLQNALIDAGFNLVVTQNNPVVDPALVGGDLLVNGALYTSQSPAYYMAAGSDIAFAGHSRGFSGYYLNVDKVPKVYAVPTSFMAQWTWRYVFWVGGAASGWPDSPAVALTPVTAQRKTQLKNLILKYKPSFTWSMLKIRFVSALAGTAYNGKFLRSEDHGATWTDLGQQYSETFILSLVSLGNNVCLAGTSSGGKILRSVDYSESWVDLGQQYSETDIRSFANISKGTCLAGTAPNGKVLRSTDYGATWTDLGRQEASETHILSLVYLETGICLAGTTPNGKILRSTDYGLTWVSLGQQASETSIFSLIYLSDGICLAGTGDNGKILRSTDYGATWSDLGQQYSQSQIYSLIYIGNGICLAGTGSGGRILRSTDYGATWSNLGQQASESSIYSFAHLGGSTCLAGTAPNGKILRSTDYGATWENLGQQASETFIYSLLAL